MIKAIEEQPDEEVHEERRVPSMGASVLELEWAILPAHRCVHQPRCSLNAIVQGFLRRLHHVDMTNY